MAKYSTPATFVQFLNFEFQIRIIAVPKRSQASLYIRFMSLLVRNHKSCYLFKNSPSLRLWCTYFVHAPGHRALQYCAWFQYSDTTVGFNSRRWKNAIFLLKITLYVWPTQLEFCALQELRHKTKQNKTN